ncbi:hypothetical protein SNOG_11982 [Parastagonospora nodorum SN15]|uniref:Uncharacterized protein n=1 Tax=Phaeosphaeria nodorum (strain SN15 / ATCC MYA-4574 / FGSC 10173) TaxID=321614 RepID=Q0U8D2_PHANO|nr:hypothetical protein SNOG_11982 [Parastagonospora nodorum SN15]EAT80394.1 hypothetical protein SNOG_11982 [Parastagonospora nodorum SN15]
MSGRPIPPMHGRGLRCFFSRSVAAQLVVEAQVGNLFADYSG